MHVIAFPQNKRHYSRRCKNGAGSKQLLPTFVRCIGMIGEGKLWKVVTVPITA